jgi:ATP-dependent exoDNAse (exonuclease V) alpha subunit
LTEINTAVKEKSQKLIALAPSSQATKQLLKKGFEADTIAGFLINTKKQQELKNNVLLVDEAGMTGVKTMSQLLQLGVKHNARIILSGDTKQHKSIEFGDSLRILEEKAKLQIVEVSKVVRQQNEAYKKAVEYLARGQTIKGYNALDKMGAIQEIPDHEQRIKRIAEDYSKSIQQKKSTLIISPTNHEGDMINIQVRNTLKKQGIIQGKEKEFTTLKNLSFTKSQKQDTQLYQNGQIIRFISNQKGGYKAGQHYEVQQQTPQTPLQIRNKQTGKLLPLPHQNPENYQVFDKIQTQLAKGDRIRLTQNSKSLQGSKMNNGTVYQVSGFTRSGDIKLTNNKILAKENGHYKYSYSETSYSSQGKDAKNILISMSDISFMGVSKEQFYVSVSRGTHNAKIYTSDKQELKKLIHKSNERITAKEITYYKRNPNQDFLRRQQKEHYVSSTKVLKYVKKENTQNKDIL